MLRLGDIVEQILCYNPKANVDLIRKAYVFSAKVHQGQVRLSGEPYLTHPLEVSGILAGLRLDTTSVAVGLLHDTVEDMPFTSLDEIERVFGKDVRSLVDGLTKIGKIPYRSTEERTAENFRKMILAMSEDIRIVLIKLADRLHNMRTLQYMPPDKQRRISLETRDIYAPLANRLGMANIKWELEDLSFRYLEPEIYQEIKRKVAANRKERETLIKKAISIIQAELDKVKIKDSVEGRPKHFHSIYNKMLRKGIPFEDVFDLVAVRIITDTVANCYTCLGIVHSLWTPIPGQFDDYIAMPKPNMYQSLHTTVIGPYGPPLEIQIRTDEMHRISKYGIAAHWRYKEQRSNDDKYDQKFTWLRQLLELQQSLEDPREFLRSIKTELFSDEVYVFTPEGEVKELPKGAVPVDFAYSIHTDIGHRCVGAKVNGKMVSLNHTLKNGDIVRIITAAGHTPNQDWLKFVKTSRAINRIRHWIKSEQYKRGLALGREMCEREFKKYRLSLAKLERTDKLQEAAVKLGFHQGDRLLAAVGYGKISPHQVIKYFIPQEKLIPVEESGLKKLVKKLTFQSAAGIHIKGMDDLLIYLARCCNPVAGDEIIGFITRGRGISIHRADCTNALSLSSDPERRLAVEWDGKMAQAQAAAISVDCYDRKGVLADISGAISKADANIISLRSHPTKDSMATLDFTIEVSGLKHLTKIIKAINQIKSVYKAERVNIH